MNPYKKLDEKTKKSFAAYYVGPIWTSVWFWALTLSFAATLKFVGSAFIRKWGTTNHLDAIAMVGLIVAVWIHLVVQHRRIRKAFGIGRSDLGPSQEAVLQEIAWSSVAFALAFLFAIRLAF